ncbi:MAG TPA: isochorismatase family cysteine hydrolase [Nitrososphaeraceae archaeon]|nr:isochorismatase family cysteine hydrolase [Nitrososphaeraceae archaeon]
MTTIKKKTVAQPSAPSPPPSSNTDFTSATRDSVLNRVEQDYEEFKKTRTFRYPTWLYGPIKGRLFKVEVEDCPRFGDTAYVEFDSARTAFLSIDMQVDFCGSKGYVDVMGYDLGLTSAPIKPIHYVLYNIRNGTDIKVIHTREGHVPDLSDAPYNKVLRSKIIGNGVGIGDTPKGGLGRLLVRGEKNWDIIDDLYPIPGEYVVDKAGKGAFGQSNLPLLLKNLGITHLVITGITTDVCVHTIMREANDYGYWCVLLKDGTGATDYGNYQAAIKQIKMQGGVFGWVSDSRRFVEGIKSAFKNK